MSTQPLPAMNLRVLLSLLVLLAVGWNAHAQPWSRALPTPQGGDYGNGVAASDVVGGVFSASGAAAAVPAVAYGVPTGFGADWRDVFAAAGMQGGLRYDPDFIDGVVFGGAGLGNAQRTVGVELTLAVVDLVGETFKDQTLSVKIHRRFGAWGVAGGVENLFIMGTTDGGTSAYGVVSGHLMPQNGTRAWLQQVTVTAGVGDGRFNTVNRVRREKNTASAFGSLAVRVHSSLSALATWNGQDLTVGASIAPFPTLPIVITPVLLDVSGQADSRPRIALSMGVGITL